MDHLVHLLLAKPSALMKIAGVYDFDVFEVGGQIGHMQGMGLGAEHARFHKGIGKQHQNQHGDQNQMHLDAPALGQAVFVFISGSGQKNASFVRV